MTSSNVRSESNASSDRGDSVANPRPAGDDAAERRYRAIFRAAHADHVACAGDEWLGAPCADEAGPVERPLAWSRRNGPWRRVAALVVGAAPGNAGGKGGGDMGAHATRIPFGGDVAGANLDVLLASAGLTREDVFIAAALNRLPDAGGGEPRTSELAEPVGAYDSSLHLLRDTMVASGAALLVALGNVAVRSVFAAALLAERPLGRGLLGLGAVRKAGIERGVAASWPAALAPDDDFTASWREAWGDAPLPTLLWLTHPSAQNMSPYAGVETAFHGRMVEARDALRDGVRRALGTEPPRVRPDVPQGAAARELGGVYATPEWLEAVGPRHAELAALWREKGV